MNKFELLQEKYRKNLNFEVGTHGMIMLGLLIAETRKLQIEEDRKRLTNNI